MAIACFFRFFNGSFSWFISKHHHRCNCQCSLPLPRLLLHSRSVQWWPIESAARLFHPPVSLLGRTLSISLSVFRRIHTHVNELVLCEVFQTRLEPFNGSFQLMMMMIRQVPLRWRLFSLSPPAHTHIIHPPGWQVQIDLISKSVYFFFISN